MIDIALALKKRIERFMLADSATTAAASVGDNTIQIDTTDAMFFDVVRHYKSRPKIGIYIEDTQILTLHKIEDVDRETGTLTISPNLVDNVPAGSAVERWPGQERFYRVYIGDVEVIQDLPAIVISPMNMQREWVTLPTGTDEMFNIDISVYVKDDGHEESTLTLLSAAQELDDLLMADLHLRIPVIPESPADRVYNSLVKQIDYGYIQKGTAFIKAAQLHWFATEYMLRLVATKHTKFDMFNYFPGKQFPDQGIDSDDDRMIEGIYTDIND